MAVSRLFVENRLDAAPDRFDRPCMRWRMLGVWAIFGMISGLVWDDRGAHLSGARVEITGRARTDATRSGGMGFFHFSDIPAGEYTLSVSHPDFAPAELYEVALGTTVAGSTAL